MTETIKWIPVAEGMPDDDENVLVQELDGSIGYARYWQNMEEDFQWWTFDLESRIDTPALWARVKGVLVPSIHEN